MEQLLASLGELYREAVLGSGPGPDLDLTGSEEASDEASREASGEVVGKQ